MADRSAVATSSGLDTNLAGRRLNDMIVSVRQRGGLFGLSRTIKLDRRHFAMRSDGRRKQRQLTEEQAAHLHDLALRVEKSVAKQTRPSGQGPDSMTTQVTILRSEGEALRLTADDQSPPVLWDLVGALSDVADTFEPDR